MNNPTTLDGYEWPTCACGRQLCTDELDRVACRICQERVDGDLAVLPAVYGDLNDDVAPTYGGSIHLMGSGHTRSHSPVPLNVAVLALLDDVPATLVAWVTDWAEYGHADPTSTGVANTVKTLRFNLEWAATAHPAFADFAHEIRRLRRSCERANGVEAERTIKVACRCGTAIGVTVTTPGARCHSCGTQYGRSEVLTLPLAARTAA